MPQHGHDEEPLLTPEQEAAELERLRNEVFDPSTVDVSSATTDEERDALVKQAHRDFEASKLTGLDQALHDAKRALVARGFEDVDNDGAEFRHPNGHSVTIG